MFGVRFLRHPDLFPNRAAGEPWGSEALEIHFAGGPYRFTGLHPQQVEATRERFGPLCRPPGEEAAVTSRLFRLGAEEFLPLELAGWTYTFDRHATPRVLQLAGLDFMGRLEFGPPLTGALFTWHTEGSSFQCLFENFFRVMVAYRLLALGGVLLHSAGVVMETGGAHLFFGPSGAGKTTLSRLALASGRTVLSDDINALCPSPDGSPQVEKLPFAGDLGRTPTERSTYPLAGLHRLSQGENALRRLPRAEATASLLASAPFVNADPHRLDPLLTTLQDLLATVPVHQLTFSKDGDFWPLLEDSPGEI